MRAIPKRDLIDIIETLNDADDKVIFEDTITYIFNKYADEYFYNMGDSYDPPELTVDKSSIRKELLKKSSEDIK